MLVVKIGDAENVHLNSSFFTVVHHVSYVDNCKQPACWAARLVRHFLGKFGRPM